MSLLADSSPPPKALAKQLSESGDFNCYGYPSSFKHPKLDAFRSFPVNCCADITDQDFPEQYGVNGRKSEWPRNVKKPRLSDGPKYGAAIAAVPLRSVPSINVKRNPEKSVASYGKDDDVGQKLPNHTEDTVQQEKSWERDSEKLAAILAEAKEFINMLDGKYSASKNSKVVQEEKASGMETQGEDDEEEVCVLTPSEWNKLPLYHKGDGAKASIGKIDEKLEKWSSHKSSGKGLNMVESQGTKIVDLEGLCYVGTKSDQQAEGVPDCELVTETKCGEEQQEHNFMDLEPEYCENHELINLQIGQDEQPQRFKVMETLKLFEEQYDKLMKERVSEQREGKGRYIHIEALGRVRAMGMSIFVEKPFGHIPGIEIGDEFRFRAELAIVGLHCQLISGIDYVALDGKKYATSVVDSGRYENMSKAPGVLIYSGQGGNPKLVDNAADQKLERGNLALMNSMEMGYPVRVIYKRRNLMSSKALGMSNERNFVYVYDGLYRINKCMKEREEQSGKLVFKFELRKLSGQQSTRETNARSVKPIKRMQVCVLDDVSQGKEKFRVRAVNGVDDDLPPPFTYITEIIYPYWYQRVEPIGCDCTNGCSDSQQCPCVLKNGGEIPFNEKGAILEVKPRVYECGPSCKCPPACMNRVSQRGLSYELEIYKTKSRGWGVRSRHFITSGSFICEYVGELLRDKEAEKRIGNDEYLFDICDSDDEVEGFHDSKLKEGGFALDAAMCGNVGRFINHSCSPNLYAQEVLYDHDDKRMPHIMFFATEDIPSLQELTYDYNYSKDRVSDVNGNIKTKDCYCGSYECSGRMY